MNINSFNQNLQTNVKNEEQAWNNFTKTGRVLDYLIYYEYKKNSVHTDQEALENAHTYEGFSSK